MLWGCTGRLEANVLSLIQVDAKTAVGQPLYHGMEGSRCTVGGNLMGGAGSEDGAIVNIGQEAMELPLFHVSEEWEEVD